MSERSAGSSGEQPAQGMQQVVLVLVGLPGAGKSTLFAALQASPGRSKVIQTPPLSISDVFNVYAYRRPAARGASSASARTS